MSSDLRARVTSSVLATAYQNNARHVIDASLAVEYEYGETGARRVSGAYEADLTVSASQTRTLDFAGVLTDAFGDGIDWASIHALRIQNAGSTPLTLGGTNQGVAAITLAPGSVYMVAAQDGAGYTSSGGTSAGTITVTNESDAAAGRFTVAALGVAL